MTGSTKTYPITDRTFAELLTEAASSGTPIRVTVNGETYVLEVASEGREDIWAGYDPEKVRQALDKYAGSWSDLDAEELKESLYRAREEGSRDQRTL